MKKRSLSLMTFLSLLALNAVVANHAQADDAIPGFHDPLYQCDASGPRSNPMLDGELKSDVCGFVDASYRPNALEELKKMYSFEGKFVAFPHSLHPIEFNNKWICGEFSGIHGWYTTSPEKPAGLVAYCISHSPQKPNVIVVSFKGSQCLTTPKESHVNKDTPWIWWALFQMFGINDSWQTNFKSMKVPVHENELGFEGIAHQGYKEVVMSLKDSLIGAIDSAMQDIAILGPDALKKTIIIVTGHSQGSGRATLAAPMIIKHFVETVYGPGAKNPDLNVGWVYLFSPARAVDQKTAANICQSVGENNWVRQFGTFDLVTIVALGVKFQEYKILSSLVKYVLSTEGGFVSVGYPAMDDIKQLHKRSFEISYEAAVRVGDQKLQKAFRYLLDNIDPMTRELQKVYDYQLKLKRLSYGTGKHYLDDSMYNAKSWVNPASWKRWVQYNWFKDNQLLYFRRYWAYLVKAFGYAGALQAFMALNHYGAETNYDGGKKIGDHFLWRIPDPDTNACLKRAYEHDQIEKGAGRTDF